MALNLSTTAEEFSQWMSTGFKAVTPAQTPDIPVEQLLARHRKTLLAFHAKGYSIKQICDLLRGQPFAVKVSASALSRFLMPPKPAKKPVTYTAKIPLNVVPPASAMVQ